MNFLYTPTTVAKREVAAVLFIVWLVIVISTAVGHAPWRDEVVAYSLAVEGKSTFHMLATLHEGHPGIWYVLLRGVHFYFPTPEILPVVTVAISAAAMALMLFYSPFSLPFMLAVLLTRFGFWEYPVMQRSYGISMLLLFLLAHSYQGHKNRGVLLGCLLFLLVNCEALSLVLTSAFLLFWFLDILWTEGNRKGLLKVFAVNAGIAFVGALASLWMMCADNGRANISGMDFSAMFSNVASKVFAPDWTLHEIARPHWLGHFIDASHNFMKRLPIIVLIGTILGLSRRPAASIAALAAMVGFCVFSALVLGGGYRHHALLLVFFLALYWIVGKDDRKDAHEVRDTKAKCWHGVRYVGAAFFVFLIGAQIPNGISFLYNDLSGAEPESHSGDVSALVHDHPEFKDAIITSDVDYFLQPLPYYLHNRLYGMHDNAYLIDGIPPYYPSLDKIQKPVSLGPTRGEAVSLGEVLDDARQLQAREKVPVLILLSEKFAVPNSAATNPDGYTNPWHLKITPEQRQAFLKSTTLLQSYGLALSDETYDVYKLNDPTTVKP